jgi:hypothetical protein
LSVDDPARPPKDGLACPETDERQHLRWRRRADRRVVLEPGAPLEQSRSRVASQPIRRPAIANDFDMTPSEIPLGDAIGSGR